MTTTQIYKTSSNTFDDKRYYVYKIKSYPCDKNLYLFIKNLIKRMTSSSTELLTKLDLVKIRI